MKHTASLAILATIILLVALSGCTGTSPAPQPVISTPVPVTPSPAPTLAPTPDPYPNASAPNMPVPFGSGKKTGEMTVYGYTVRPSFSWGDPSWNSPRQQAASGSPLETQKGYNTKKPQDGNTFLFVYLNVAGTGSESVYAPSPSQIIVVSNGKTYGYSSLESAQTIVDGELGHQYDYLIGTGGTGGYVQPGKSNNIKGFLIYELPASFTPEKTYVVATPDSLTKGVWKLV
jgi:hypothetical protein